MPRTPGQLGRPCDWVKPFPAGTIRDDAPAGVLELARLATTLRALIDQGELTVSGIASSCGVHRTSVQDVLAGRVWIDTHTLARLERAAGRRLWGDGT